MEINFDVLKTLHSVLCIEADFKTAKIKNKGEMYFEFLRKGVDV
jgi:hypothetical protein